MFRLRSSTLRFLAVASGTAAVLLAGVLLHRYLRYESTPDALLQRADDLSWKNQWMEAAPLYARAERLFAKEDRPSQALYAHVSQFIPRAESEEIPVLLLELQQDLALPVIALSDQVIHHLPTGRLDAHLFQLLTSKGQIYEDMGRWKDAAGQYTLALDYAQRLSYWRGITQTGGLRARAYEHENHLDQALMSINEAIAANAHLPHELYFVPQNLAIKSEIFERLGHTQEAHALYTTSAVLIDSLLATAPTPDVERELPTVLSRVYSGDFELLSRERKLAHAFDVIEKARGRVEVQSLEHHAVFEPHQPTVQEQRITELNLKLIDSDEASMNHKSLQVAR